MIVVADRPPAAVRPGDTLALDVHVVSDRREPLAGCVVTARLAWAGGEHEWRFTGDVGADACVRVGTLQAVVPDVVGPLTLELTLDGPVHTTNAYESMLSVGSERSLRSLSPPNAARRWRFPRRL